MNKTNLFVSLGIGLVAVIASVMLGGTNTVQQIREVVNVPTETGAISGYDFQSSYFSYGGVRHWAQRSVMQTATTTICAIQAPASTSTLQSFTADFDTSSTTASIITIAKATTAFATTTQIGTDYAIAANGQAFINASTSLNGVEVIAGNTWINVGMKGGTGTMSPTGYCQATFIESF